jgi:hypothetical protein
MRSLGERPERRRHRRRPLGPVTPSPSPGSDITSYGIKPTVVDFSRMIPSDSGGPRRRRVGRPNADTSYAARARPSRVPTAADREVQVV